MKGVRLSLAVIMLATLFSPLRADTIAIAVRARTGEPEERALALLAMVEQGAMDHLFEAGHIVFNLVADPQAPSSRPAIDEVREGGASLLVIVDVRLELEAGRGLMPVWAEITILRVETDEVLDNRVFHAASVGPSRDLTAETAAQRLGALASEAALESLGGDAR